MGLYELKGGIGDESDYKQVLAGWAYNTALTRVDPAELKYGEARLFHHQPVLPQQFV